MNQATTIVSPHEHNNPDKDEITATLDDADKSIMAKGAIVMIEEKIFTQGQERHYLKQKSPLYNPAGDTIGLLGFTLDITEIVKNRESVTRKKVAILENERVTLAQRVQENAIQAQAERELKEAVIVLTGSIVHDLRTPIATIRLLAADLQKDPTNRAGNYEGGTTLNEIATEMGEYINQTLKTLSKAMDQAFTPNNLSPCSIRSCLQHTLDRYPFAEHERDLITVDIEDFQFMGNELLMIRVLTNLIKNALEQIRQHHTGTITLFYEAHAEHHCLHVKDTAGGASAAIVSTIFDGYVTHKPGGTGLGLAFCQHMLKAFGGSIRADSVEGDSMDMVLMLPKL